ncbi:MAG TPA: glycosyltransferase [Polyangia bacterium]
MEERQDKIPNQFHFVWDDNFFPYSAYLAIRSVAMHAKPERIFLFKTPELDDVPNFKRLRREVECLEPVNIDLPGWLEQAGLPCTQQLLDANRFLKERKYHGSVSDLLRSLNLYLRGGIYLDTDTLTLRDMDPLRVHGAFLAEERILVSSKVWKRNSRWRYFRTAPLTLARDLCTHFAYGVRVFQAIAPLYVRVVHNAVMGFRPGHPLMRDALLCIAERYPHRPERYPLLGPDTLQDLIAEKTYEDVVVLPPHCFSPLGPTMTTQYFRAHGEKALQRMSKWIVEPDTYAIHWSNNGTIAKAIPQCDEELNRAAQTQLFSRLAIQAAFPSGLPAS